MEINGGPYELCPWHRAWYPVGAQKPGLLPPWNRLGVHTRVATWDKARLHSDSEGTGGDRNGTLRCVWGDLDRKPHGTTVASQCCQPHSWGGHEFHPGLGACEAGSLGGIKGNIPRLLGWPGVFGEP